MTSTRKLNEEIDLYKFIEIPKDKEVSYTFCIGKYPVTNAQYERFLNAPDYGNETLWKGSLKFNEDYIQIGRWGNEGWDFYKEQSKGEKLKPRYWEDERFGKINPNHPVVGISGFEANTYCEWLFQNWNGLLESKANISLKPQSIRLPLENEWQKAAGGINPVGRCAWDETNKETTSLNEILRRANVKGSEIGHTTAVDAYPLGKSPYDVMDMSGNVWEWQANYLNMKQGTMGLRGGSWNYDGGVVARVALLLNYGPYSWDNNRGFRVVCVLPNK